MELNINPFKNSNPMSWEDAAKLSAILSLAAFFTTFLLPYSFSGIIKDLGQFCFEAVRFIGSVFFTNFITLAGLASYTKKETEKNV
jgi:hypothetical protein